MSLSCCITTAVYRPSCIRISSFVDVICSVLMTMIGESCTSNLCLARLSYVKSTLPFPSTLVQRERILFYFFGAFHNIFALVSLIQRQISVLLIFFHKKSTYLCISTAEVIYFHFPYPAEMTFHEHVTTTDDDDVSVTCKRATQPLHCPFCSKQYTIPY